MPHNCHGRGTALSYPFRLMNENDVPTKGILEAA
jgi:hypothetical protein